MDQIRANREAKGKALRQIGVIPFYIKPSGEVLTRDEHLERQQKKDAVERAARERI